VACRVKTDSDPAAIKVSILEVRIASREPHRKEDPVAEFEGGLVTIHRAPASASGDLVSHSRMPAVPSSGSTNDEHSPGQRRHASRGAAEVATAIEHSDFWGVSPL
jgi:hypothetical protein